ncbi:MAG: thioredoxin domain-containing protein [Candidatus Margulisiibacteriota bacterium]
MNRLINEKSPYLRQHAQQAIHWYAWGDEAFQVAEAEKKPVFISIGYSTCHWCHVMAHDSFEDEAVVAFLNAHFVSIKVDREEHPDVDQFYMTACQYMTGAGGWPLTLFALPDKRPFFAGTFFPKQSSSGRIGFLDLMHYLSDAWQNSHSDILSTANQLMISMAHDSVLGQSDAPDSRLLTTGLSAFKDQFDATYGGFGPAPKFPSPHQLLFLLQTQDADCKAMAVHTLKAMRYGGIFDQIGFGFHRYSTDAHWLLPHFEKMLYDQALLLLAYTEGFLQTQSPLFSLTVEQIIDYIRQKLSAPEGGFYCGEDADSEGEEGKFYVWNAADFPKDWQAFWQIDPAGNFAHEATGHRDGTSILHVDLGCSESDFVSRLTQFEPARKTLYDLRETRIHPGLDSKVLTDWNGLMIAALAKASRVFSRPDWLQMAEKALSFLESNLCIKNQVCHSWCDGVLNTTQTASDRVFLAWGCFELYQTTLDSRYLNKAVLLMQETWDLFGDEKRGGLYSSIAGAMPIRQKEGYDGAIPSVNAVAFFLWGALGRLLHRQDWIVLADQAKQAFADRIGHYALGHGFWLYALTLQANTWDITLSGNPDSEDFQFLFAALRSQTFVSGFWHHDPDSHAQPVCVTICRGTVCMAECSSPDALKDWISTHASC